MSVSMRWSGALAVAILGFLAARSDAQRLIYPPQQQARPQVLYPFNPNPFIGPNLTLHQAAYNVSVLGQAAQSIPPWLAGYNPYPQPIIAPGGAIAPMVPPAAYNPYALATAASYNPYTSGMASLSTSGAGSPYSLSTMGSSGYGGGSSYPGYSYYPSGPAGELFGVGSIVSSLGSYNKDIQTARLMREQAQQASIETAKRRIEFELWYDSVRPTAAKMIEKEKATDLTRARTGSFDTEILSGQALNVLRDSIIKTGSLNRGPKIELDEDQLRHINLTSGAGNGNIGMIKNDAKFRWPEALMTAPFAEERGRLHSKLRDAVAELKDNRQPVASTTLKDIEGDFKTISEKLNESADAMAPSQYIEARRFLNQLQLAIRALKDPNVVNYFNNTWIARGRTVSDLISTMNKREGLLFAPASPGDEAAYRSLYYALRAFEAGLQVAQK